MGGNGLKTGAKQFRRCKEDLSRKRQARADFTLKKSPPYRPSDLIRPTPSIKNKITKRTHFGFLYNILHQTLTTIFGTPPPENEPILSRRSRGEGGFALRVLPRRSIAEAGPGSAWSSLRNLLFHNVSRAPSYPILEDKLARPKRQIRPRLASWRPDSLLNQPSQI